MTIRLADYVARHLAEAGLTHVFMITGGGAMHLNDALTRHPGLTTVFNHHEQASAMAAEAYARLGGRPAILNVTTGPGGLNALNGVFGAHTDSIAMIVISGQVRRETMASTYDLPLRQLGDQEVDIVPVVRPITKHAVVLREPSDVRYELEKALWLASSGRPGPVWIDIPLDVQGARIDPATLRGFDPLAEGEGDQPLAIPAERGALTGAALRAAARDLVERLAKAERPVILPGTGVRIAGALEPFRRLVDRLGIPVATAFNAHDLMGDDHPCLVGRPGTVGDRAGNFAVQNSDLLLVLGCRLNIRQTGYNFASFARAACKVMVDADRAELSKPTMKIDVPIQADLRAFLGALEDALGEYRPPDAHRAYLAWCRERRLRYPACLPEYEATPEPVNPYVFARTLFDRLGPEAIVVTANATACITTFQAARIKDGQRLFSNSGSASMGYDLPASIGAHHASGRPIVCLAGDGSIMMNLQELQTIAGGRLPIKIFLLNNEGYHSIRQTQTNYFPDNVKGCGPGDGVTFPDFLAVARAFGIESRRCFRHDGLVEAIDATLEGEGPQFCEIMLDKAQPFAPKPSSRRLEDGRMVSMPLEDLWPFLPREEFLDNMIIPSLQA
jgi:acetolactate synthase-1/2/3 large subunit